ncbi:hypothetical protein BXY51_006253 [Actinoplanes cyaneus]|nr:hypothetical protein [Actinoplanes cyaneus]
MVRPSADQLGRPGSNVAVNSFRTAPLATSTVYSAPVWSRNASRELSADQLPETAAAPGSAVNCRSSPVVRSRSQMSSLPPRSVEYDRYLPSGDYAGSDFHQVGFLVRGRGGCPIRIVQMSLSARNATDCPSGESTGLPIPSTGRGCGDVKSRRRLR